MTKELEEYKARLCDSLNRVTAADYEAYGIEFHKVIKSARALLRVIDAVGEAEGVMGYTSDHESGYADGRESMRQSIIDAILNNGE